MSPSINEELEALPVVREYTYDVKGMILSSPRTDLVFVPTLMREGGAWNCVVVWSPEDSLYPRGGYDIVLSHRELQRCVELDLRWLAAPVRYVTGITPGGENDYHEVPDNDLPGMWSHSDFEGGIDEVRGPDWTPRAD